MTARYWFRPKRYGFGATPVTWEGWAFAGFMIAFLTGATWYLLAGKAAQSTTAFIVWAVLFVAVIAGSIMVTKSKTEGSWQWRWGDPE